MPLTHDEYREVQLEYLKLAKLFHRYCKDYNLTYYLIGGSALGAVRHGGFIPWDYDMDVAMLRKDYERFSELCLSKGFAPGYRYASYKTDANFWMPHALILIEGSELCFDESGRTTPMYLDVFPYDDIPDDKVLRKRQARRIQFYNHLVAAKQCLHRKDNARRRWLIKRLARFVCSPISLHWINAQRDHEMRRYEGISSERVTNMAGRYSYMRESVLKADLGTPRLMCFEDFEFYVPERVESFLTGVYGDYTVLPDEESQRRCWASFRYVRLPDGRVFGNCDRRRMD